MKLQPKDIKNIQWCLECGIPQINVARIFKVSQSTISHLKNEKQKYPT